MIAKSPKVVEKRFFLLFKTPRLCVFIIWDKNTNSTGNISKKKKEHIPYSEHWSF